MPNHYEDDSHLWKGSSIPIEKQPPLEFKKEPITSKYKLSKQVLGEGVNGCVMMAYFKDQHNQYQKCAVKSLFDTEKVRREIRLQWKSCGHPNIVKILDVYEDRKGPKHKIHIVMECMQGGELFDRLAQKECFTEREAAKLMQEMTGAIAYLHSLGIAHRDIKLENFLYPSKDSEIIKLADFGFAKECDLSTPCYSSYYVAPEVLKNKGVSKEKNRQAYAHSCDIWSLGVILFMILSGKPPFYSKNGGELSAGMRDRILKGKYKFEDEFWKKISKDAKGLVRSMLTIDPTQRPTAQEVMNNPWISTPDKVPTTPLPTANSLARWYSSENNDNPLTLTVVKDDFAGAVSLQRKEEPGFFLPPINKLRNSLLERRLNNREEK